MLKAQQPAYLMIVSYSVSLILARESRFGGSRVRLSGRYPRFSRLNTRI